MTDRMRGWLRESRDRVVGSDPGLNRLSMALGAALAMSSTLGVEFVFSRAVGADARGTLVAMLLGTVIAMMGSMALTGPATLRKVRTAVFFPVATGLGMLAGAGVSGHTDLLLGLFVVIMFVAVFVRRFGIPFFFYGFMGWMGYFFAAFMGATLSALPGMLIAVAVASVWVLLLSMTVLRTNVRRTLRRTQRAFTARAGAVARACADLLATVESSDPRRVERARQRVHLRQLRLAETALVIEAWSAEPGALPPERSAASLRRHLIDAQLAIDALASGAGALASAGGRHAGPAMLVAGQLARRDHPAAERSARALLAELADTDATPDDGGWPARTLATAALDFTALVRRAAEPDPDEADEEFQPAVALAMGNLPGSPSVARDVEARGGRWNPLSRLSLTTRQAVQVGVAGALAIVAGHFVSETRYYWAVIAAFIAFTGTGTRSETFLKAVNRVLGTLLGLGAGIGLAHLTAGHTLWVLVVIVASMSCGFYLVRISYASMIFFVTIMVSQLYSVLHEFSAGLLVLRLEETAVGAAAGIAVGLLVVPTSTRDTVRAAWGNFCTALAELLTDAATRLQPDETAEPGDADALIRAVDNRLRQLALVARPLLRPLLWGNSPRLVRHRLMLCAMVAAYARAVAVGVRRRSGEAPAGELAATCRALAADATTLAEARHASRPDTPEPVRELLCGSDPPPDTAAIGRALIRLAHLLDELARIGRPAGTLPRTGTADAPARDGQPVTRSNTSGCGPTRPASP